MQASELRKCSHFHILKLLFLSIFCRYTSDTLSVQKTRLSAYMYRQISNVPTNSNKALGGGGGGGGGAIAPTPPPPPPSPPGYASAPMTSKAMQNCHENVSMEDHLNPQSSLSRCVLRVQNLCAPVFLKILDPPRHWKVCGGGGGGGGGLVGEGSKARPILCITCHYCSERVVQVYWVRRAAAFWHHFPVGDSGTEKVDYQFYIWPVFSKGN